MERVMDGLTVRFVGGDASDDVIREAQLCLRRANLQGPLTLTVRWAEPGVCIKDVRLLTPDCGEVRAVGPGLLPALHKLCDHARSLKSASTEDRLRWQKALAARRDSGTYVAIAIPTERT